MNNVSNIKTERKDAIVNGKSGIEIYCSFTDMQKNNDEVFHYLIIKNEKEFWTLWSWQKGCQSTSLFGLGTLPYILSPKRLERQ